MSARRSDALICRTPWLKNRAPLLAAQSWRAASRFRAPGRLRHPGRPQDQRRGPPAPAAASSRRKSGSGGLRTVATGPQPSTVPAAPPAQSSPSAPRRSSVSSFSSFAPSSIRRNGSLPTTRPVPNPGSTSILGALTEDLIDTSVEAETAIAALKHTPGAAFGSCRYKLGSLQEHRGHYERLIEVFRAHDIGFFFYNGGGDSQDTAHKVSQLGAELGYPMICVRIPKTMDNDLPITDCSPGFGSVAKYVATSLREATLDLTAMSRTSTKVFTVELMG